MCKCALLKGSSFYRNCDARIKFILSVRTRFTYVLFVLLVEFKEQPMKREQGNNINRQAKKYRDFFIFITPSMIYYQH